VNISEFDGLPAHPLLIHVVVVMVPLAALLLVLSVAWPAARRRLGILTPIAALIGLAFVPVAQAAGEALEHSQPHSELIERHEQFGEQVLIGAALLFVFAVVWWAIHLPVVTDRFTRDGRPTWFRWSVAAVAALSIGSAALAAVQVYQAGHTGAESAWGHVQIADRR
jgi:cytochrome bd-type quinol oxidase subunit 2